MRTIDQISPEEIKAADGILAVDPENGALFATILGDERVAPLCPPGQPAHKTNPSLEIECRDGDVATLNRIVAMVRDAHGRVSSRLPNPPKLTLHNWDLPE